MNETPTIQKLFDLNTAPQTEDICDYLDLNSRMHLVDEPNSLTLIQLNTRGMIGKLTSLSHLILDNMGKAKTDVVLLCETWLNQTDHANAQIPGYKLFGNVRSGRIGGGTGILIHNSLRCRQRKDLKLNTEIFEHTVVELKTETKNILPVSGYRPPNTNAKKFLREYKDSIKSWKKLKNHNLVVGLDNNMDFLKSDKHAQTQGFLELNLDSDLEPTITRTTRVTTKSATLIDNVFLSQRLQYQYTSNILIDDISDHMPSVNRICLVLIAYA